VERLWAQAWAHSLVANEPLRLALQLAREVHIFIRVNTVVIDDIKANKDWTNYLITKLRTQENKRWHTMKKRQNEAEW
jgi:hypothetical protein